MSVKQKRSSDFRFRCIDEYLPVVHDREWGTGKRRYGRPLKERLLDLTDVRGPTDCWKWKGYTNRFGYGTHTHVDEGRKVSGQAHRKVYEALVGPIPEGLTLDHLCRNRACVNPAHLEPVSLAENIRRCPKPELHYQSTKTHCPHGHPYDDENTMWVKGGTERRCRACNKEWARSYKQRRAS